MLTDRHLDLLSRIPSLPRTVPLALLASDMGVTAQRGIRMMLAEIADLGIITETMNVPTNGESQGGRSVGISPASWRRVEKVCGEFVDRVLR